MISKRAYKSFVARAAKKERLKKYNQPKEESPRMGGLLAKRNEPAQTEEQDDVMETYFRIVRELAGGGKDEA